MDIAYQQTRTHLLEAAQRLYAKGLSDANSSLSLRVVASGTPCFASINPKALSKGFNKLTEADIGIWQIKDLKPITSHSEKLGKQEVAALHAQIFAIRGDAGGVFVSGARFTQALNLVKKPMRGIFDEQVRQIGLSTKRLALKNHQLTRQDKKLLNKLDNAFLLTPVKPSAEPMGVLILGVTHERVVFNAELMEKCAKAYVLASATGKPVTEVPFYVKLIANKRKLKDQAYTAECYAKGDMPTGFTAY